MLSRVVAISSRRAEPNDLLRQGAAPSSAFRSGGGAATERAASYTIRTAECGDAQATPLVAMIERDERAVLTSSSILLSATLGVTIAARSGRPAWHVGLP